MPHHNASVNSMIETRDSDVLIVGGGLFGCFAGLFLAQHGRHVTLLEKGLIGAQASNANFGNLRLHGRSESQYPLSLRAQELWENYDRLTGESCDIERSGHLYIARSPEGSDQLKKDVAAAARFGVESILLEGDELWRRFPQLSKSILLASFSPRSAVANPRRSTAPVARALTRLGGRVIENCEVTGCQHTAEGFQVWAADGRAFRAATLINAAGAWAAAIASAFGDNVPMFQAGPPQFVTEPLPYRLQPVVQMVEGDVIVRQVRRGNLIFAGYPRSYSTPEGDLTHVDPTKTRRGMQALARALPVFSRAEVIRVWSGVEGYLPDMLPVIGPSLTTTGLFHAFGGCGGGFQIAPAVGEIIAALLCGDDAPLDLTPYRIGRFSEGTKASDKIEREFDPPAAT